MDRSCRPSGASLRWITADFPAKGNLRRKLKRQTCGPVPPPGSGRPAAEIPAPRPWIAVAGRAALRCGGSRQTFRPKETCGASSNGKPAGQCRRQDQGDRQPGYQRPGRGSQLPAERRFAAGHPDDRRVSGQRKLAAQAQTANLRASAAVRIRAIGSRDTSAWAVERSWRPSGASLRWITADFPAKGNLRCKLNRQTCGPVPPPGSARPAAGIPAPRP